MFKIYKIKYYCEKCNICLYLKRENIWWNTNNISCPVCGTINKRLQLFEELSRKI